MFRKEAGFVGKVSRSGAGVQFYRRREELRGIGNMIG